MSIYDYSFKDTRGNVIEMSQYKGKVLLLVNTATKCGLTPQLKGIEALYQSYKGDKFDVIGFPCNQFANQEPETNESVTEVCKINYGVTFLLSEKIDVNGKNEHPLYSYLKKNAEGGIFSKKIKWNFTKFLVSADGKIIKRYAPTTLPKNIEKDIKNLIK